MEREKEIAKLVNVLRQTARTAQQAQWMGGTADASTHCVDQYNRVLARLSELDAGVAALFQPLPADSSLTVVAIACRQLGAYFADEVGAPPGWGGWPGIPGAAFDPEAFKDFWRKSAAEVEDFGEFIRENIDAWLCRPGRRSEKQGDGSKAGEGAPGSPDAGTP